ncbi:hypothetical protein R1sor_025168 [Riccia sorocarpa]|uniref:Phosphatidic acid phosphatase type 2/haloperoxidase domain-containing protein n=1 Tax=Riccia sorocarpa TaxID=122646 RepID=A0ABD3GB35_9MARC
MGRPGENHVNNGPNSVAAARDPENLNTPLRGAEYPPVAREGPGTDIKALEILKYHWKDWAMVVLIAILEIIVYVVIPPFRRFAGRNNITQFQFPIKSSTVPTWSILLIAVLVPLAVFFVYYLIRRSVRDFHNAFLGLGTAVALTALLTDSIKNTVGMPRPDFFWRCFPDGQAVYNAAGSVVCHGDADLIKDGYKSFPSGHASWSFAGLGYLSFYLAGKLGLFDKRGRTLRVFIIYLPLLVATLVSVSRVDDYQHRWVDIIVGGLIGFSVAYFCYRQHFPSIYSETAGYCYKYIPGSHKEPTGGRSYDRDAISLPNGSDDLEAGRR